MQVYHELISWYVLVPDRSPRANSMEIIAQFMRLFVRESMLQIKQQPSAVQPI